MEFFFYKKIREGKEDTFISSIGREVKGSFLLLLLLRRRRRRRRAMMIGNEINALRSKNRPFDDPCRDNKDSELDSFFCVCVLCVSFLLSVFFCISLPELDSFFVCVCVFCVCFVSSLGFFFLYLSRDKNTRESERCVCGKKKVRARSVFPSSDDDGGC